MNVAELDVEGSPQRFFTIYPIGDTHIEKVNFDTRRFERYVNEIANDPYGMYVFVGDAIDGRTPDMKLYDPDTVRPEFKGSDYYFKIQERVAELFGPLRGTPGVVVQGNHDEYQKWSGFSPWLATTLGAKYLGGEGLFRLNVSMPNKRRSLVGYARHIIGGGKRPGSKVNNAEDLSLVADADFYVAGHIHDSIARVSGRYTLPRRGGLQLVRKPSAKIIAPSFLHDRLEGFNDYASKKGFPPTDQGLIAIDVDCENTQFYRRELRY